MAVSSAHAALGAARKKMKKIAKHTEWGMQAISLGGDIATAAISSKQAADTAQADYQSGYDEIASLEGEPSLVPEETSTFKKIGQTLMPGGDKGYFQMPEGEVQIGDLMYDKKAVKKAGSFLDSDVSSILDDDARERYLKRVAPGKPITAPSPRTRNIPELTNKIPTIKQTQPTVDQQTQPTVDQQSETKANESWLKNMLKKTFTKPGKTWSPEDEAKLQAKVDRIQKESGLKHGDVKDGMEYRITNEERGWYAIDPQKTNTGDQPIVPSYSKGGDFITDGPQQITVGDNPGGRERVTIVPLETEQLGNEKEKMFDHHRGLMTSKKMNNKRHSDSKTPSIPYWLVT